MAERNPVRDAWKVVSARIDDMLSATPNDISARAAALQAARQRMDAAVAAAGRRSRTSKTPCDGETLKATRMRMQITQAELGEQIGVSAETIALMEAGVEPIELRTAIAISLMAARATGEDT